MRKSRLPRLVNGVFPIPPKRLLPLGWVMFWLLASRDCQWPRSVLRKTSLGRNDSYNQITDSESGSITDDEDDKPGGVPLPEGIGWTTIAVSSSQIARSRITATLECYENVPLLKTALMHVGRETNCAPILSYTLYACYNLVSGHIQISCSCMISGRTRPI